MLQISLKKITSLLLALCMTVSLLPAVALPAAAEDVGENVVDEDNVTTEDPTLEGITAGETTEEEPTGAETVDGMEDASVEVQENTTGVAEGEFIIDLLAVEDANFQVGEATYATFEDAISAAQSSGNAVILLEDYTLLKDLTIPADVDVVVPKDITLLIPYSMDESKHVINGANETLAYANAESYTVDGVATANSNKSTPGDSLTLATLSVEHGASITVEDGGQLAVGGVLGGRGGSYGGLTVGAHSDIVLKGNIFVEGLFTTCGFVTGNGTIYVDGGDLYAPFTLADYQGGKYFVAANQGAGILPFIRYAMVNVTTDVKYTNGGALYAYASMFTQAAVAGGITLPAQNNETTMKMIGAAPALLETSNNTVVSTSYDGSKRPSGMDIGQTEIVVEEGNVALGTMKLTVTAAGQEVTVSTASLELPLPYHFSIVLESGTVGTIPENQTMKILPGAMLEIRKGANLVVNGELAIYDGFTERNYTAVSTYPDAEALAAGGLSGRGRLIVDGQMSVYGTLAGLVECTGNTGKIVVDADADTEVQSYYEGVLATQGAFSLTAERCTRSVRYLEAMVWDGTYDQEGQPNYLKLAEGETYYGLSDAAEVETFQQTVFYNPNDVSDDTDHQALVLTIDYAEDEAISGKWFTDFAIVFDANGGLVENQDAITVTYEGAATITAPTDPQHESSTFVGWNTKPDGSGTSYFANGQKYFSRTNLTLYAVWSTKNYNVTLNAGDGAQLEDASLTVQHDGVYPALPVPTKTGYTFLGWYFGAEATAVQAGEPLRINSNHTLSAKWSVNTYTVVYNGNGADGGTAMVVQSRTYGDGQPLSANTYTRTGYTFDRWNTAADGTGTDYTDEQIANLTEANGETITLYAQWAGASVSYKVEHYKKVPGEDRYTLAYMLNSSGKAGTKTQAAAMPYSYYEVQPFEQAVIAADGSTVVVIKYDCVQYTVNFVSQSDNTEVYNSIKVDHSATVPRPDDPIREGYTFNGWVNSGGGEWYFSAIYSDTTIYAKWTINQYTLTFADTGNTVISPITQDYATAVTAPANPEKTGYTFTGWDQEIPATMPAENRTISATWKANQYTITFADTGDSEIAPITQDYGTAVTAPADPVKEGYTFDGWDQTIPETMPATNPTITAKWQVNQYNITWYHDVDDTAPVVNTYDYGAEVTLPAFTRSGYDLVRWQDTDNDGIADTVPVTMPAKNQVFTAVWELADVTITFTNTGDVEVEPITQKYTTEVTAPTNPTKEGHTFAGWYENANFEGNAYVFTTMPAEDITLCAKWDVNSYTITWNVDGQETSMNYAFGANIQALENPVKEGYTFAGWDADGDKAADTVLTTMPAAGITYTALWTTNSYTVTWDVDGAKTEETYAYGATIKVPAKPTKEGHTFVGWSGYTENMTMPAADTTFIAQWTANTYKVTWVMDGVSIEKDCVFGAAIEKPADPAKEGYTFTGWMPAVDATMPAQNVTYTATWTINTHKITYMLDNAEHKVMENVEYGTVLTAIAQPTKEGYTFSGWNGLPATMPDADVVVTGNFTANHYTVTFHFNVDGNATTVTQNLIYDQRQNLTKCAELGFVNTGYVFKGWRTASEQGEVVYTDGQEVEKLTAQANGNIDLYAVWEAGQNTLYTVVHKQQNVEDNAYTTVATQELSGVTDGTTTAAANSYLGFKTPTVTQQTIKADGSTVVEILYDRNVWTATFINGAETVSAKELRYGAAVCAPVVAKAGYVLRWNGWTDGMTMPDRDITINATWTPAEGTAYKVETYVMDLTGAYGEPAVETKYGKTEDTAVVTPENKEGFTFDSASSLLQGQIIGDGSLVLKVYYVRNQYSLTWMPTGGELSGDYTTGTLYYGAPITAPSVARTGYTFSHWEGYTNGMTMPAANTTFTAKWTANTDTKYVVKSYMMKLDSAYELISTENATGTTDKLVNVVPESKIGFTVNESASTLSGMVTGDGLLELTIYYDRNQYDLAWVVDGSQPEGDYSQGKMYYGAAITVPNDPEKVGYTFAGWDANGDGEKDTVSITMPADDLTFTALWTANSGIVYTVKTYTMGTDGQYNAPAEEKLTGTAGEIITLTPTAEEGFVLNEPKSILSGTIAGDGSLVLEVYYDRCRYVLVWEANGGSLSGNYSKDQVYYGAAITVPEVTLDGYTFVGWYTDTELTQPYVGGTMPAADLTLYAAWQVAETTYTVKHLREDLNGNFTIEELQTGVSGITGEMTAAKAAEYEGFTALAVTQVAISGDGSTVVEIRYVRNSYNLTVQYADGVSESTTISVKYGAEVTTEMLGTSPNRIGYTFDSWDSLPAAMPAEAVTVTAKWVANSYIIHYGLNGGTNHPDNPSTYTIESIIVLQEPTRAGYTFIGWTGSNGNEPQKEVTIPADTLDALRYIANWEVNTYIVHFDANGGVGEMIDQEFAYDAYRVLSKNQFVYVGHTFAGWNTAKDGSGTAYEDQAEIYQLLESGTVILYAQWATNIYTVNYNPNGAVGTMMAQQVTYGDSTAKLQTNAFTKTGYAFDGWNTVADGSGTAYEDQASLTELTSNLNLYAQWKPITYTVVFDANGGAGIMDVQEFTYGVAQNLTQNLFTREGYVFSGWMDGETAYTDGQSVLNLRKEQNARVMLKAQWKVQSYAMTFDPANGEDLILVERNYGVSVEAPVTPVMSGYRFDGWYAGETKVAFPMAMPAGGANYTAKWTSYLDLLVAETDFSGEKLADARAYYASLIRTQRITYNTEYAEHKVALFAAIKEASVAALRASVETAADKVSNSDDLLKGIAVITIDGSDAYIRMEDANYAATNLLGISFLPELLEYEDIEYAHFPNLEGNNEDLTPYYRDEETGEMNQMDLMLRVAYDALAKEGQTMMDFIKEMMDGDTVVVGLMDGAEVPIEAHAVTAEGVEYMVAYTMKFYNRYHDVIWDPANGEVGQRVSYNEGETIRMTETVPIWENHIFLGWDGYQDGDVMAREDITYTARWKSDTVTITFDTDGGASIPAQSVDHGACVTEPQSDLLYRKGYTLVGWYTDAAFTDAWDFNSDTVTSDITLYAKWEQMTYEVRGIVLTYDAASPGHSVHVLFKQGNEIFGEAQTDNYGYYTMEKVPVGIYNVVAVEADGRTKTAMVAVEDTDTWVEPIRLPEKNVSSELMVAEGAPGIVVGGLDAEAEAKAASTVHVTVSMEIEKQAENAQDTVQTDIKTEGGAQRSYEFFEIVINKTVEDQVAVSETISATENLLEIRIPFETRGRKDFKIYRYHGNDVHTLEEEPNGDGEYLEIEDGCIVIHAKKFSTYAISYLEETAEDTHEHNFTAAGHQWTGDGCEVIYTCSGCGELSRKDVIFIISDDKVIMDYVPNGLNLIIAGYTNGQLDSVQIVENAQAEKTINVTGEEVVVFFVGNNHMPLRTPLK